MPAAKNPAILTHVDLRVTPDAFNYVMQLLNERPMREVRGLVEDLERQAQAQVLAVQQPVPVAKESAAAATAESAVAESNEAAS